jgi:hypothetical protein
MGFLLAGQILPSKQIFRLSQSAITNDFDDLFLLNNAPLPSAKAAVC